MGTRAGIFSDSHDRRRQSVDAGSRPYRGGDAPVQASIYSEPLPPRISRTVSQPNSSNATCSRRTRPRDSVSGLAIAHVAIQDLTHAPPFPAEARLDRRD